MDYDLEVQELETQLGHAIARRAQLLMGIEHNVLLLANDPSQNRLPISEDVLIVIFCSLLFPNPAFVRRLMLVCRHWHSVITNTPILWSVINLRPSNNLTLLSSWTAYCRTCIQRSGASPLEVTIDYREVVEPKYLAAATIYPAWTRVGLSRRIHSFFKTFQHSIPAYSAAHFARFEAPIRELIGADCSGVGRWKALTVDGANWDYRILSLVRWCLGGGSLPRRTDFWTGHIVCRFPAIHKQHNSKGPDTTITTIFPCSPPALQYLSTPLVIPLGSVDPRSLHDVEIDCRHPRAVQLVVGFRQLRRLTFQCCCTMGHQRAIDSNTFLKEGNVYFPHLIELNVMSELPSAFWSLLDAPQLEIIRLKSNWELPKSPSTYPAVTVIVMGSSIWQQFYLLSDLIRACPSLKTVACHGYRRDEAVRAARLYIRQARREAEVVEISSWVQEVTDIPLL